MKTRHEQVSACSIEVLSSMLQNKLLDSAGAAGERHGSNYGGSQLLGCNQADSNIMCLCIQLPDVGGQPAHSRRSKILKLSCADCQCVIIGDPRRIGSGCTRAQAMQKWNVARVPDTKCRCFKYATTGKQVTWLKRFNSEGEF